MNQTARLVARFALPAAVAIALAFGAMGAAHATPGVTPLAENKPVELEGLSALANAPQIEDVTLRAVIIKGKPATSSLTRPVMLPGGVRAVAWSECSKASCLGYWALLDGDNESLKVVARGALPIKEKINADDGITFAGTSVADLDGSGKVMVLFHYGVTEPARKAPLPSVEHDYLSILDPAQKKVIFQRELKRSGAPTEQTCTYTLIPRVDALFSFEVRSSCTLGACLAKGAPKDCAPPTTGKEKFLLKKGAFVAGK